MANAQARIEALIQGARPRSLVSLDMGLKIRELDGVGATLTFQIPTASDKPTEVFLSTAPSSLVADLWKWAG